MANAEYRTLVKKAKEDTHTAANLLCVVADYCRAGIPLPEHLASYLADCLIAAANNPTEAQAALNLKKTSTARAVNTVRNYDITLAMLTEVTAGGSKNKSAETVKNTLKLHIDHRQIIEIYKKTKTDPDFLLWQRLLPLLAD